MMDKIKIEPLPCHPLDAEIAEIDEAIKEIRQLCYDATGIPIEVFLASCTPSALSEQRQADETLQRSQERLDWHRGLSTTRGNPSKINDSESSHTVSSQE